MADMAKTQIAPAVEAYAADVARAAAAKKSLVPDISCAYEIGLVKKLSALTDRISVQAEKLEEGSHGASRNRGCGGGIRGHTRYRSHRDE